MDSQTAVVIEGQCKSKCFNKVVLPGFRHRFENYTGTVEVETRRVWELPQYTLEYTYGNQRCSAKGYAAGDCKVEAKVPEQTEVVDKRTTRKIFPIFLCGILLAAIGFILLGCVPSVPQGVGIVMAVIGIFMGIAFLLAYYHFKKKTLDSNREKRIEDLKTLLTKLRLDPLTAHEREIIMKKLPLPFAKSVPEK
ncbi:MAG: hypothetical protein K2K39_00155 [Clostridia bacterium]|nr:hypothetical protein [Clostridia bacterium]